jgi:hypothetical protein
VTTICTNTMVHDHWTAGEIGFLLEECNNLSFPTHCRSFNYPNLNHASQLGKSSLQTGSYQISIHRGRYATACLRRL